MGVTGTGTGLFNPREQDDEIHAKIRRDAHHIHDGMRQWSEMRSDLWSIRESRQAGKPSTDQMAGHVQPRLGQPDLAGSRGRSLGLVFRLVMSAMFLLLMFPLAMLAYFGSHVGHRITSMGDHW